MKSIRNRNRKGQGLVEYALIIAGVALIAAVGISVFGHKVSDMIDAVAVILPGADTGDNGPISSGHLIETTDASFSGCRSPSTSTPSRGTAGTGCGSGNERVRHGRRHEWHRWPDCGNRRNGRDLIAAVAVTFPGHRDDGQPFLIGMAALLRARLPGRGGFVLAVVNSFLAGRTRTCIAAIRDCRRSSSSPRLRLRVVPVRRHVNRRGQALVEFAVCRLVVYLLLAAILTFGQMTVCAQGLQQAVDVAAREISRTPAPRGPDQQWKRGHDARRMPFTVTRPKMPA